MEWAAQTRVTYQVPLCSPEATLQPRLTSPRLATTADVYHQLLTFSSPQNASTHGPSLTCKRGKKNTLAIINVN